MTYYQYIRVHHDLIPYEVMDEYNLHIEPDVHVNVKIRLGMYGLKDAGIISLRQIV